MADILKQLYLKHKTIILYIFFGALTTLVNMVVFFLLRAAKISPATSNVIAWFLSVLFAFFTNKYFVFDSKKEAKGSFLWQLLSFFSARIISGAMDTAIVVVFIEKLRLNELFVKIFSNVLVIIFNYAASRLIIFKRH